MKNNQSTKDGTHINGITLNCGANLKNKKKKKKNKTPQKTHQNVKDQISYISKLR